MADVMEERIHSIQRTAGFAFVIASVVLGTTMLLHPSFQDVNNTGNVLQTITASKGEAWMQLHAIMAAGFVVAAVAFFALAVLLHLKGSSGSAAIVSTCALLGAGVWVTFLTAELYAYKFFTNWFSVDAGSATMLFSTVWFWKMGALYAGALLFFGAVIFAGVAGVKREILPLWLGWGGALVAIVGALVYVADFWGSTATGRANQPMQWPAMRYGVGLPLQLWMLGVGVVMLVEYFQRPMAARVPERPPLRSVERPMGDRPARPVPPVSDVSQHVPPPGIPHPALAPEPEPQPPQQHRPTGTDPTRPKPPQIFPG